MEKKRKKEKKNKGRKILHKKNLFLYVTSALNILNETPCSAKNASFYHIGQTHGQLL